MIAKRLAILLLASACGGKGGQGTTPAPVEEEVLGQPCSNRMLTMPDTDESKFGPLEVGADWTGATYTKVSRAPFASKTHGGRYVEVYVNDIGLESYLGDGDVPEGTILVKTSWEAGPDGPTTTPGPIFVMRKEAAGYSPDHEDWYYAIHWAEPTEKQLRMLGGPIYWRGKSMKVSYCYKCHDNYDRSLGGVPKDSLAAPTLDSP